jgi:DNA-binding transcriptional LysR family regulator
MIRVSQPALSLQIRALEDEIGVRLFERNRHKSARTSAGVVFREDATEAFLRPDQAVHKARLATNGKPELLRIGFNSFGWQGDCAHNRPSVSRV